MNEPKPWMKQPGELHDINGVPIYPGDLLRTFHFRSARRRELHYLYHTAVYRDGAMFIVPTSHLEPTKVSGGGSCVLSQDLLTNTKVIHGHGPGAYLDYKDRPLVALSKATGN
jgi:hypothetical protein